MGVVLVDNRCVMSEYQKDRQGVLRGKCNECSCPLYRSAKGLACTCLHLPVKHEKIGDKRSLPGSYSGAGSPTASHVAVGFSDPSPYHFVTSQSGIRPEHQYTTSSQQSMYYQAPPSKICVAEGCNNRAYYDSNFGFFDYCSPRCRDVHLLPEYNKKLERDIAEFHQQCSTDVSPSEALSTNTAANLRQLVVAKSGEGLGLILLHDEETSRIYISGASTRQGIELLRARQIFLYDRIVRVCEKQVKTKAEVEEIIKRKDKITITLDNSDAFILLLKDFCKALPSGTTQVVCLRHKANEDKYGINVTKNLLIDSISKGTEARKIGLKKNCKVLLYSCISHDTFNEPKQPDSNVMFEEHMKTAYAKGHHLLLALGQ